MRPPPPSTDLSTLLDLLSGHPLGLIFRRVQFGSPRELAFVVNFVYLRNLKTLGGLRNPSITAAARFSCIIASAWSYRNYTTSATVSDTACTHASSVASVFVTKHGGTRWHPFVDLSPVDGGHELALTHNISSEAQHVNVPVRRPHGAL